MSNRFNSGAGGYTCDKCHTLLWWGCLSHDPVSKRNYYPPHTPENTRVVEDYIFCAKCIEEAEKK